jgi:hypothetical protein
MDQQFQSFLDDLAGELKKAAERAVWDIPTDNRTKHTISAYRAAVGMVGMCVQSVLAKHRSPTAIEPVKPEPDGVPDVEEIVEPIEVEQKPESLFDDSIDKPRRRRTL